MHQDKMTKEEIQAERDRIRKDQEAHRKKTTTMESAKPTPSSIGSESPNEALDALKTICDDLTARAIAIDKGQLHPRECDYNAGTYIVLWRLLEASVASQAETLKTLKSIDERLKRNNEILTAIFQQETPWKTP